MSVIILCLLFPYFANVLFKSLKSKGIQYGKTTVCNNFKNQLAKQGVLPCEPLAGKVGGIVLVEGFVDEAAAGVGVQ